VPKIFHLYFNYGWICQIWMKKCRIIICEGLIWHLSAEMKFPHHILKDPRHFKPITRWHVPPHPLQKWLNFHWIYRVGYNEKVIFTKLQNSILSRAFWPVAVTLKKPHSKCRHGSMTLYEDSEWLNHVLIFLF